VGVRERSASADRTGLAHPDREIWRLALPAFLALVAEPLFLLADSAIVGHLGTAPLAGLGVAGVILQTVVGLCVFLAYGTTASVARRIGAGDRRGALTQGIDGLWLAVAIGVVVTLPVLLAAEPLCRAVGAEGVVLDQATTYLRIGILGVTPLLLLLAGNGVLRGLQDTRTPLVVAVGGNLINIALNLLFVPVLGLGIAGSALGSVIAQLASAVALVAVVIRSARRQGARLSPDLTGIRAAGRAALPLVVRTLTLRASLLVTTYAVTVIPSGDAATHLAAHQVAFTLWTFLAFVLDAIAIAAQALTGRALGEGDRSLTRALTTRMVWWGTWSGVVLGLGLAALSPFLGALFSSDPGVSDALVPVLLVAALAQPICGVVFVLDGVLIGAGDGRYLAWGGLLTLALYAPVVALWHPGLVQIWIAFSFLFMGMRFAVLTARARGDRWMKVGA
jgi:putative MATE family efflux protein